MSKKQTGTKHQTAQDFINVEDIADDMIFSRDGYLFGFLQVRAGDDQLLGEEERAGRCSALAHALSSGETEPWTLLSIPRTVDTAGMIDALNERRKITHDDAKLKLINGEITSLQELTREGTKEPMIVLKCWIRAARGADQLLKKRLRELRARLSECSVPAELLGDQSIVYLCKVFADLVEYQSSEVDVFEDVPLLEGQRRFLSRRREKVDERSVLRDLIAPVGGLRFGASQVCVGSVVGRIYGAMRYPTELDYGWAVDLMNVSDCVTAITYHPGELAELGDALSRSILRSTLEAASERDPRRQMRFERQATDAGQLIEDLDFKNASIGHISILAMPFTSREEELEDTCRAVCGRFARKKVRLKPLGDLQQEGYKSLSPYHVPSPIIQDITRQIMPLTSLMGGSPMTVNIYRDDKGCYFARTMDGGIISLDLQFRGEDRTNGNMVTTGEAGQGKSTALKHILQSLYMTGVRVIVIDPEREYRDLCHSLGGSWLDVGGGSSKINPLQIRPVPEDDDEEQQRLYQAKDNAMALHLYTLEVFFHLYLPTLDDMQLALLKMELVELYKQFGIDWETDVTTLGPERFPVLKDLHARLIARQDAEPRLRDLALLLHDMALGATSFLWNGHTNVDTNSDFLVLDTQRLQNTPDTIKRAQYFNNLSLCWDLMSRHRQEPVVLVCDEAHIVLDPAIPQTAMFLRNMAKRARKYEGYLFTVFQSVSDMLFPEIRIYGQAILDNSTYKLAFGCDGKNLQDTVGIFRLTEAEKNVLLAKKRGHALAFVGRQHIPVDFDIPQYKLDLMGRAGGR